ncbi:MAG: hypothetical protein QE271_11885 [Bacteriovoracaceae bacterium]|nr:hypothetical protein [Bacteriovoracaceae bacterium]
MKSYDQLIELYQEGYRYGFLEEPLDRFIEDKLWAKYFSLNIMPYWSDLNHDNAHLAVLSKYPEIARHLVQYYSRVLKEKNTPEIYKAFYLNEALTLLNYIGKSEELKVYLYATRLNLEKFVSAILNNESFDHVEIYKKFKLMADQFLRTNGYGALIGADQVDGISYMAENRIENYNMWFINKKYKHENENDFVKYFDIALIKIFDPSFVAAKTGNSDNGIKINHFDPLGFIYHAEALLFKLSLDGKDLNTNPIFKDWRNSDSLKKGAIWSNLLSSGNPWRDKLYYPLKTTKFGNDQKKLAEYLLLIWQRFEAAMNFYIDNKISPELFYQVILGSDSSPEEKKRVFQYLSFFMSSDPSNYPYARFTLAELEFLENTQTF